MRCMGCERTQIPDEEKTLQNTGSHMGDAPINSVTSGSDNNPIPAVRVHRRIRTVGNEQLRKVGENEQIIYA